ncbi:hypothetical protein SAMN02745673_00921 [Marinactinospora thermotolerans DSM 45154]|uniref:Uncharacterized protein n=1 Tax=Marinactinospora thermotolerans DSM 45154 TaxID=1122192 RepID=A0A1T4M2S9_9ACTN|nr:hypothetical protein SAMN02745673_00921 [Marinactinospora thermotolerans DSM 45154]
MKRPFTVFFAPVLADGRPSATEGIAERTHYHHERTANTGNCGPAGEAGPRLVEGDPPPVLPLGSSRGTAPRERA